MDTTLRLDAPRIERPSAATEAPRASEPAATPEAGPAGVSVTISAQGRLAAQAEAQGAAAEPTPEPDAATAVHRPAVRLYLDNAARPENRPPESPLRT